MCEFMNCAAFGGAVGGEQPKEQTETIPTSDRVKIINIIRKVKDEGLKEIDYSRIKGGKPFFAIIADHLIENGIGDIAAEKHRADVAEEALNLLAESIAKAETRRYDDSKEFLINNYKKQAEQRLKEKV